MSSEFKDGFETANDPADNRYLECAVEGNAGYMVSGDQDLLELGNYQGMQIITPCTFLVLRHRKFFLCLARYLSSIITSWEDVSMES